jgi:hypothetical protein
VNAKTQLNDARRRKRRLRAALVLLRRRVTKACNKFSSATELLDDVTKHVGPLLAEFSDVLPGDARAHLERMVRAAQEGRADLATACKLCKGEVDGAIRDVSSQLGIEGQIREALRPLEQRLPDWLVASPVAQGVAAVVVVVLVGGGTAGAVTAIANANSGGGSSAEQSRADGAASPAAGAAQGSPISAGDSTLPDECDLVTAADAEAVLGEAVVSVEGGGCTYHVARAPEAPCPRVTVDVRQGAASETPPASAEIVEGLGDLAYINANALSVLEGDIGLAIGAWFTEPPCGASQAEIDSWHDEWREIAEAAISRLP